MIRKLRHKFIIIIMSILLLIFTILIVTINLFSYRLGQKQNQLILKALADSDGQIPFEINSIFYPKVRWNNIDTLYSFTIKLDDNFQIIDVIANGHTPTIDSISSLVESARKQDKTSGTVDGKRYLIQKKDYGHIIVFIDDSVERNLARRLLIVSLIIGCIGMFFLFFVSYYMSNLIVKPVQEAFIKQKQFISDASHELKTPLSTIAINAEVLASEIGPNKWLSYIQSETTRMNTLVNQLLSITRLDNSEHIAKKVSFDFSQATLEMILPFECRAFEEKKNYTYDIQDSIFYYGEQDSLKQLVVILIDNALKNTAKNDSIHITLSKTSSKVVLTVFNTGTGIKECECNKIFERFYRSDASRNRTTGGYGLGLSIAQSIVTRHNGKIIVRSKEGCWAKFIVTL